MTQEPSVITHRSRSEDMTAIRLVIVVPTYGNWTDCMECLELLSRQNEPGFHVILADDGAPTSAPTRVSELPFVTHLRLAHRGFAATCNAAAELAISKGATHLLLLNDDTTFGDSFIGTWLRKIQETPDAILGPIIYYHDRPQEVWFSGGAGSIFVPFVRFRRQPEGQMPVDILTGCALLVPVSAWKDVGGFDESYVTYYEDFDLLLRARSRGIPAYLVVEPELAVQHKVARTAGRDGPWPREYRLLSSRLRFIRKTYTGWSKGTCLALAGAQLLFNLVLHLPAIPSLSRLWQAIVDGLQSSQWDTSDRGRRIWVRSHPPGVSQ